MKERYNVEISDIHLTIVSDESEEFVNATVEKINDRVNDLIVRNKRCSKLDAALLCALDYCGEYAKAERRIRNLEAQISLYDANLKRLREEIAAKGGDKETVKTALGVADGAEPAEEAPKKGAHDKVDSTDKQPKAAPKGEVKAEADTVNMFDGGEKAPASNDSDKPENSNKSKLEQIEMLLRGTNG